MPHPVQLGISKQPAKQHAKNCYCNYTRWKKSASFIVLHYDWTRSSHPRPTASHSSVQIK